MVVETGFECPEEMPFQQSFDLLVFCSDEEVIPDDVLAEVPITGCVWCSP